ncbi:MAG TPA: alpha-L-rhamnosidase, partial [Erysipelotrichaceae bacterium]|nr:alpha-L-rhamnosidase [Erysipelotrichaceae bacterium]
AFAAMLDLDDPESLTKKLVEKIRADNGIFNAGIFGMKFTYDLLHRYGYDDVIEHWLTQDSEISFRQMLSSGSKAMAELFGGTNYSYNHAMFTSFVQWYFEALGGIQIAQDAIGFNKIMCKPYFSCELDHCDARVETVHGTIESSWKRINGKIEWQLSVPEAIECILPEERSDATLHLTRTK